ncbi:MAG: fibronectin type III domain-containing protein [Bacteroidota bacterium]
MDYTDDACMYMYTTGQKTRMQSALNSSPRSSLLNSLGCVPPGPSCGTPANLAASAITDTTAVITWGAVSGATTYSVQYRPAGSTFWNVSNSASNSVALGGLSIGTSYEYQVRATCGTVIGNYSASSFFSTTNSLCPAPTGLAATSITTSGATLSWTAVAGATGYNVVYRVSGSTTSVTLSVLTNSATLTGLAAATSYSYTVQAICNGSSSAVSATASFTTQAGTCSDTYESNETLSTSKVIATNTNISARIGTSTDKDWFRFSTTSGNTNIRVVLDQLPADYDLELYGSNGKRITSSVNGGTTAETITRNTTSATTYYVQVYGYNGAFNANLCYRLRVNTSGTAFRTSDQGNTNDEIVVQAEKINSSDLFQVFPNPASDNLNVRYFTESETEVNIEIVDMLGKTVYTTRATSEEGFNTTSLQLNDFNNGIYFVRLSQSGSSEIRKFIVKH